MKNSTHIILTFLIAFSGFAQQEKGIVGDINWLNNWTEFKPNEIDYGEPTQILAGNITEDTTLSKGEVYLLLGSVFVAPEVTLTIESGTVIFGDYNTNGSLTIARNAHIIAKGKATDPIIFTSNRSVRKAGDWGGIIILGGAPINKYGSGSVASFHPKIKPIDYANTNYGGENTDDFSGELKYVRIEYAGKRISQDTYFNGLLLASIGTSTVLEHVMVSHCGEDAFEVWGGNASLNNVVSYRSKGTDFKFNYGTTSVIFNSLAVRSPYASNGSGDKCLEVLSYINKEEIDFSKNKTVVKASNLTFLNLSKDLESAIKMNLVHEGIYVGENTNLNISKSVISGFNPAVILDDNISINQNNLDKISFKEMYFNNCNGNIFLENNTNNDDLENYYGNRSFLNVYSKSSNAETFIASNSFKKPDFRLRINKIIASNIDRDALED